MSKYLLVLLICFGLQSILMGQQLRSERVGDFANMVLLLPYSGFHPDQKTKICDYDLNIDVLDSNKKNVYHELIHIRFTKPDTIESEAYPVFIMTKLKNGNYVFYMKLANRTLGDKNEQKFNFTVPAIGKKIGTLFLIGYIRDAKFWLRDMLNITSRVDSLHLRANLGLEADSIKISISQGSISKVINISTGQLIDAEIKSDIVGMNQPVLKLQVFAQKIKYTKEVLSYDASSSFSDRYSLEDQVQQLRYIMNQNELRYIRSLKPEKYKQAIEEFWRVKDPTPDTNRNEFRETFEARVLDADQNYTIRNYRPGWKTDRGKIFIKYGSPDEIVSDAYPLDRPPYIIWYYYSENKIFQFYDFDGWGNYQLGSVSDE